MVAFESATKFCPGQDRPALHDINPEIAKGEFVFLVGQPGSGESTFLRLILREYRPMKGTLYVAGRNLSTLNQWKVPVLRRQIGAVFQDFRLLPGKTIYENAAFVLQVISKPSQVIREMVPETLRFVGLEGEENRLNEELSGDEQQRVTVARAFVGRPEILVADEPTGNLDPETSVGVMKLLDRINRTETTVIMATHDSSIVGQTRRRVLELRKGELVRDQVKDVYGVN